MKRKIIQIAESTQLVSLPRKWAKAHNLIKGNELEVTIKGDTLEISAGDAKPKISELKVDISSLTPFLVTRFMARAYQKGYDILTIRCNKPELMQAVRNKVPELLGFEIVNRTQNSCVIQSISSQLEIDFKTILRRTFLILIEMSEILLNSYKTGNKEELINLTYRDYEVNKFCYFCLRTINKGYHNEGTGTTILYYQIESLEDLGDEYKKMGLELSTMTQKNKLIIEVLKEANILMKKCYEFFYSPTSALAVECIELYKRITKTLEDNLGKNDKAVTKVLFNLLNISRILYHIPTMRLDTLSEIKEK